MATLAGKLMHALQYDNCGKASATALKHVEIPIPVPKKNEVLVKVEALALNPVDWKIQTGMLRPIYPHKFPTFLATSSFGRKPQASDSASLTAHQALTQIGINLDPDTVSCCTCQYFGNHDLCGVGHYAVQLAKLRQNTHVTATCGARNIEFVKSLGADEVLDYTTPEGSALQSPSGRKYDVVIQCVTGIPWSTLEPNLSKNGKSENLEYLVKLVNEGKLKTAIDSKYPLSKAEDAWAKCIDGHATGKIIVEP
uniref:Alcohol dehydrogenase-like C-terminal domain-containing protein n=1 Tax=Cannabis sativa TaxID=3483 RepID=A0A803PFY2_CANSA